MDGEPKWTLGEIKEAGYYLWAVCHPDHTRGHIFMLDLDQLIEKFGAPGFDGRMQHLARIFGGFLLIGSLTEEHRGAHA